MRETPPTPEPALTPATFADLTELSVRRVRQLIDERVLSVNDAGKIPLAAGVRAYLKFLRGRRGETDELRAARLRKTLAEGTLAEMEVKEREGELVPVDELIRRLSPALIAMRQRILSAGLQPGDRDCLLADIGRLLNDALAEKLPTAVSSADPLK